MGDITLVTGATGFVGSRVARKLLERGHRLRLLVRPSSRLDNISGLEAEIVCGDLQDEASLVKALEGVKYLFHVAADYRLWVPDPKAMMEANVGGTRRLMQAAKKAGVEKIVYCSSVAALATAHGGQPATETSPVKSEQIVGAYKQSKYWAEQEVERLCREEGLPAVIVNPSTPIGPGDIKPTPTGKMILDCVRGKMPAFVQTGLNIVHVDDVAEGHLLALEKGRIGEKYILGGENMFLGDFFALIAACCGRRAPKIRIPQSVLVPFAILNEWWARRTGREPRVTREMLAMSRKLMFFSSDKAKRELGYSPRPASEAAADAVNYFLGADFRG